MELKIENTVKGVKVTSPYNSAYLAEFKQVIPSSGRAWNPDEKVWYVAPVQIGKVAELIEKHYGKRLDVSYIQAGESERVRRVLRVEYIGGTREREDGSRSAYGFVEGNWNAIFPESVLRLFFGDSEIGKGQPAQALTLYGVLNVSQEIDAVGLKSAYRRMARQWHPDVCSEPNASDQFRRIQQAFEVLSEPMMRRKYDAGLMFERSLQGSSKRVFKPDGFRPPFRSGLITADVKPVMWRVLVEKIHQWDDVVNEMGQTMVSSWPKGADRFQIIWV